MSDVEAIRERGRNMGLRSPRLSVTAGSHGKAWLDIPADCLEEGDIIKGMGVVHMARWSPITGHIRVRVGESILPKRFDPDEMVTAFIPKDRIDVDGDDDELRRHPESAVGSAGQGKKAEGEGSERAS